MIKKKLPVVIFVSVWLVVFCSIGSANATDVGGMILEDTTWGIEGSPYFITSTIQIGYGATLTIGPGVIINGGSIEVFGVLDAVGTATDHIFFDNVSIVPKGNYDFNFLFFINLEFIEFNSGSFYGASGSSGYGSFNLRDSILKNIPNFMYIWYPQDDCYIERNIFMNSAGISVGHSGPNVYIRNNVFYGQTNGYAIQNWASYSGSTIVEYNSFLSTDRIAVFLPDGYSPADMMATNNYWNTTDTNTIDSMIYDRNDSLGVASYIDYLPIFTEPHPDTPVFVYNNLPTANAGQDQIVYDEITLDGSSSVDLDDDIVSYQWIITNKTTWETTFASGMITTVPNLTKGFHDVTLQVTDSAGAFDSDTMFFSSTGLKGDFDFDGDVDGDDLGSFTGNFGAGVLQ